MSLWSRLFGEIEEETQYKPDSEKKKFKTHDIDSFQDEDLLKRQREEFESEFGGAVEKPVETEKFSVLNAGGKDLKIVANKYPKEMQNVNVELSKKFGGILGFIIILFIVMFFPPLAIPLIIFWIIKSAKEKNKSSWKRSWKM